MFAVLETGGKQYRVSKGDVFRVEKLEAEAGKTVTFDRVLLMGEAGKPPSVGTPFLKGATVEAKVRDQIRGEKIRIMKFRRRKDSKTLTGHRQYLTLIEVTKLSASGGKASATKAAESVAKPQTTKPAPAKPAPAKTKQAKPEAAKSTESAKTTSAETSSAKTASAKPTKTAKKDGA